MSETAKFTFTMSRDGAAFVTEEPKAFLSIARAADGLPLRDPTGKVIGTFHVAPDHVWDDATETPERDAMDVTRAREVMEDIREHGTIRWEQVKAELGI